MPTRLRELKWSEPIIVFGEGIDNWSRKYRTLTHCIAGIGEKSGWIRLYPISSRSIQTFDVVQFAIRDEHPDKIRPESRKVHVDVSPKTVNRVEGEKARIEILGEHLNHVEFLHNDSWRGKKTLGLIQPIYPEFIIDRERKDVKVKFKCCASRCLGHRCGVLDVFKRDRVGRKRLRAPLSKIDPKLVNLQRNHLLGRNQLWFVMGTLYYHPHRWIVVEIHVQEGRKIERLRRLLEA